MLAVDNLNGIELCGRTICCDHVKQYKIPKEFMYLSDSEKEEDKDVDAKESEGDKSDVESDDSEAREEKAREKWEKKLYKPTGPDGQGWGDFRKMSA